MTSYDYQLKFGMNPVGVLMNRKKFESLPPQAQEILRKYSGEWIARQYAEAATARLDQLQHELTGRNPVPTTASDQATATEKFQTVYSDWLAKDARNPELLKLVQGELAKLR